MCDNIDVNMDNSICVICGQRRGDHGAKKLECPNEGRFSEKYVFKMKPPRACVDLADVRNKLGPMMTVLDIIEEAKVVIYDNESLNNIFHDCVKKAQHNMSEIKTNNFWIPPFKRI